MNIEQFGNVMYRNEQYLTCMEKYEIACNNFILINNKYLVK
jgi:hypothetical protein